MKTEEVFVVHSMAAAAAATATNLLTPSQNSSKLVRSIYIHTVRPSRHSLHANTLLRSRSGSMAKCKSVEIL